MNWAICPARGLPRLFRYDLDEEGVVARLDKDNNLLRINPTLFAKLAEWQKSRVMATHENVVTEVPLPIMT